jgi:hypothetical protein
MKTRSECGSQAFGVECCIQSRTIENSLFERLIFRIMDHLNDSSPSHDNTQHRTRFLTTFESIQDLKTLLLDHIESRRRGEGNLRAPGAPSGYLSSICPDKPFLHLQPTTMHHTSIIVWAKKSDDTLRSAGLDGLAYKALWLPCLEDKKRP